jgi:hypothetical protein
MSVDSCRLITVERFRAGARRSGPGGGSTAAGRRLLAARQQAHRRSAAQTEGSKAGTSPCTNRQTLYYYTPRVTDLSAVRSAAAVREAGAEVAGIPGSVGTSRLCFEGALRRGPSLLSFIS